MEAKSNFTESFTHSACDIQAHTQSDMHINSGTRISPNTIGQNYMYTHQSSI